MSTNDPRSAAEDLRKYHIFLGAMCVILPVFLMYLLFAVFPPYPWPTEPVKEVEAAAVEAEAAAKAAEGKENAAEAALKALQARDKAEKAKVLKEKLPIRFFGGWREVPTTLEERLLLLVIVMGALGSYIHAATSFADFVGNRQFAKSWTVWYLLRPFIGVGLALVIYAAVRGGLLSMVIAEGVEADEINPFGIAALAGLTGMFSKQAADKLNEVFSTLFKSEGDKKRLDSLTTAQPPEIKDIDTKSGPTAGGTKLVITGTGFVTAAKVTIGGEDAVNVEVVNDSTIKAETPPHSPGVVDIEVINADGQKGILEGSYTYVDEGDGLALGEGGGSAEESSGGVEEIGGGVEEVGHGEGVNGAEQLAPTIDSIEPNSGPLKGMGTVEIIGNNFSEGATVMIGGKAAILVDASIPTSITVIVPPSDKEGAVDVFITNTDGQSVTETEGYIYTA